MNHDNHDKTVIDHTLEQSASTPVPPEVEARLHARLAGFREKLESQGGAIPRHGRHWVLRVAVGAAAVFALGFVVWLSLAPTITLADVQAAIEKRSWVHIVFDSGAEQWTSLVGHKSFSKGRDGSLRVIDYTINKRFSYKPESGEIEYKTHVVLPDGGPLPDAVILAPKNPLDFQMLSIPLLDMREEGVPVQLKQDLGYVEKHSETVDGQQLLRFDWYCKDRMERTYLSWQIWVDPQTCLPVSSRTRIMRNNLMLPDDAFSVGRYDFPDTGPEDIYALGAPRDVPVIDPYEPSSEEIKRCLDAIKEAANRWPERYRVVQWPAGEQFTSESYEFHVSWWDGKPTDRGPMLTDDYRGVKIHAERLVNFNPEFDEKYRDVYLPMPTTAEQILRWWENQTADHIQVSDGEKLFTFRKSEPGAGIPGYGRVFVESKPKLLGFTIEERPGYYLWPCADMRPPDNLLANGPDLKPGTVMLWGRGPRAGQDFHIDPTHDMICIKQVWWEKRDDEWVIRRQREVLKFDQLPSGQWYASKHKLTTYPDPENRTHADSVAWNVDIKVLDEGDFPPDTFNGQKRLEEAEAAGAKIETR